ncbi:MAG: response regulator transcription factor [Halobacteriovoraceae bacterium]|jgi:CheY-like chemotaxis protein|nr:response regulator transcription factor [Halobacteriovoraceae bacterium]
MDEINVLILDQNKLVQTGLKNLINQNFKASITCLDDAEEAIEVCKGRVFTIMIVDPMCPDSFDGEEFIRAQRQFYSINKDTPIIVFTEDIEFVTRITDEFSLHPETKIGPITKILNPINMALSKLSA